ncbi:MAG: hypothetical protein QG597_3311 [Actinomycetota bacterium]|nr:hypothetical protein [Actinomycetota bacterium]
MPPDLSGLLAKVTDLSLIVPSVLLFATVGLAVVLGRRRRHDSASIGRPTERSSSDPRGTVVEQRLELALTIAAAGIATALSVSGMWKVFGDVLGFSVPGRVALAGFLEIAMVVSAIRARRNLRLRGTVGHDGIAVWVLALLSAVIAASDAHGAGRAIRFAAPLVAAWLWHGGLATVRQQTQTRQRAKIAWRWTRERLAVRLGLAEPVHRATSDVDRARRLARLTRARLRLAVLEASTLPWLLTVLTAQPVRTAWAVWRLQRQALAAVEHLHLGTDPAIPVAIRGTVAAVTGLRAATAPTVLTAVSPWAQVRALEAPVPAADDQLCEGCHAAPATRTWPRPHAGSPFHLCAQCVPATPGTGTPGTGTPGTGTPGTGTPGTGTPGTGTPLGVLFNGYTVPVPLSDVSSEDDAEIVEAILASGELPSIRALRSTYRVGQDRACRIQAQAAAAREQTVSVVAGEA